MILQLTAHLIGEKVEAEAWNHVPEATRSQDSTKAAALVKRNTNSLQVRQGAARIEYRTMIEGTQFGVFNPERFLNGRIAQIERVPSFYFETDQNGWLNRNALKLALSQSATQNVPAFEKAGERISSGVKKAKAVFEVTKGSCEVERWIEPTPVFDGASDGVYGVVVLKGDRSVEESPDFDRLNPGESALQLIFAENGQSRAASPAWH